MNITLSFHSQKSGYPLSTGYMDLEHAGSITSTTVHKVQVVKTNIIIYGTCYQQADGSYKS